MLPVFQMFLSLLAVEKPALGRGLGALMSGSKGESGTKATEMLMSFQAKRTRVGRGLGAFLKGGQRMSPPEEPKLSPSAPAVPPGKPTGATSLKPVASMRAKRPSRPAPKLDAVVVAAGGAGMPNYRRSRRPRAALPPAPSESDKSEPAPATAALPYSPTAGPGSATVGEPAFQRPSVRQRPAFAVKDPAPLPPAAPGATPAFRLSLFIVDLSLWAGSFILALNAPPGSRVRLTLCCLAVVIGGALGVWAMLLEPDEEA